MKLSMSLIAKYLDHYHPQCDLRDEAREIRGVRFLSDSRLSLSPEYAYIGRADQYFSDKQYAGACLITGGKSRILCYDCDYEELLNDLLSAFEFYNEWEMELHALAAEHKPLSSFMDCVTRVLDTPMSIMDLDGNLLAGHEIHKAIFPGTEYLLQNQKMPSWMLSWKVEDMKGAVIQDLTTQSKRYRLENYEGTSVSMYLSVDGERLGFWQIYESDENRNDCHFILQDFLAPLIVKAEEFSSTDSALQSNRSVILRLLGGECPAQTALDKFLSSNHLHIPLSVILIHNLTIQNYTQRSMVVRDLNHTGMECFALDYQGDVLLILSNTSQKAVVREISSRLGLKNVSVNISMPVHSLKDLPIAYRQTKFTLNYQNGPGVYVCQNYAMEYLMENLRSQELVSDLLHPAIGTLTQYDRENNTELLETLRVFMMEDKNQLETAKRLHTHRNTIKYRLERIDQLTGIDFGDWNERNYLCISLLLNEGYK